MSDIDIAHVKAAVHGAATLVQYARGDGWTECASRPELSLVISRTPVAGSPLARFRAVGELPFPPDAVLRTLCDCPRRLQWDGSVHHLDVIELPHGEAAVSRDSSSQLTLPKEYLAPTRCYLLHSQTRPVGPISARDFVDACAVDAIGDGAYVNGGASVPDARFPERSGVVRGWNSPGGGWIVEPLQIDNRGLHTRLSYVVHSDIKGWIPSAVINHALIRFVVILRPAVCYHM